MKGNKYKGDSRDWKLPDGISPYSRRMLSELIADLKAKNITVYFANGPYILDGKKYEGYDEAERRFRKLIEEMGSEVIDSREQVRFPRDMVFDTIYHLNAEGRARRSDILIKALQSRISASSPK
jgi:hypothetical protein